MTLHGGDFEKNFSLAAKLQLKADILCYFESIMRCYSLSESSTARWI